MTPRVFAPAAFAGGEVTLDAAKSRHLAKVLRLQSGARVVVFDGDGNSRDAEIIAAAGGRLRLRMGAALPPAAADAGIRAHVGQALCAPAKMDWAIEKMTELGCAGMTPLVCAQTPRPPAARPPRWRRLAAAAAEQCGRATVPAVGDITRLGDWADAIPAPAARVLLSPRARMPLADALAAAGGGALYLAVGGESGFTADEEERLQRAGFAMAHLGARVLRAETAALAALAVIASAA